MRPTGIFIVDESACMEFLLQGCTPDRAREMRSQRMQKICTCQKMLYVRRVMMVSVMIAIWILWAQNSALQRQLDEVKTFLSGRELIQDETTRKQLSLKERLQRLEAELARKDRLITAYSEELRRKEQGQEASYQRVSRGVAPEKAPSRTPEEMEQQELKKIQEKLDQSSSWDHPRDKTQAYQIPKEAFKPW
jgi:hypothetical protein